MYGLLYPLIQMALQLAVLQCCIQSLVRMIMFFVVQSTIIIQDPQCQASIILLFRFRMVLSMILMAMVNYAVVAFRASLLRRLELGITT